jgi:hypothetical protein
MNSSIVHFGFLVWKYSKAEKKSWVDNGVQDHVWRPWSWRKTSGKWSPATSSFKDQAD